ncbi:MAG: STAS domain-containing protein [Actinomycetales bacterium]
MSTDQGIVSGAALSSSVLTVVRDGRVIVWLFGDVDYRVASDLRVIAQRAPEVASHLVVEGSRVTFCDSTLLHFIALMASRMPVIVRRPTRVFRDILDLARLSGQVTFDDGQSCGRASPRS